MNTYVCPICGKTYTSATAMAQCVAECAKKEDKTKALKDAESTMFTVLGVMLLVLAGLYLVGKLLMMRYYFKMD